MITPKHIDNLLPKALKQLPAGCFLVGGCVRDLLLGALPDDYDVAVTGDVEAAAAVFADANDLKVINLSNQRYQILRLVDRGLQIDFVPLNGVSLAADLGNRDFTINAMAYEPATKAFTNLHNGLEHLEQGKIVAVSAKAFEDDPLRLLRAFRFAARFGFIIDDDTLAKIAEYAHLAAKPAAERILYELKKLLAAKHAAPLVRQMGETAVLYALFPELADMHEYRSNNFSNMSSMEHTFSAVEKLEALLNGENKLVNIDILREDWFVLKLGMLLHDVGKPKTHSKGADDRVHYYTHEAVGAWAAVDICKRLRCSNTETLQISGYVAAHMQLLIMFGCYASMKKPQHKRALFFMDNDALLPNLFFIYFADAVSKGNAPIPEYLEFLQESIRVYNAEYLPRRARALPVNGHDLRKEFSPPEYLLAHIIRDLSLENVIRESFTKEEALLAAHDSYHKLKSRAKQIKPKH